MSAHEYYDVLLLDHRSDDALSEAVVVSRLLFSTELNSGGLYLWRHRHRCQLELSLVSKLLLLFCLVQFP